jgi:arylsulfatase A-like enzyme
VSKRPNIVFLIADDHRYEAIRTSGNPDVETPVLDRLVDEGTSFTNTTIMGGDTDAVCIPSRACLLTSVNPRRAVMSLEQQERVLGTNLPTLPDQQQPGAPLQSRPKAIDPNLPTFPEVLRDAGYRTFITGKWHNDAVSLNRCFAEGKRIFLGGMCDHERVPLFDYQPTGAYCKENQYLGEGFSTELFGGAARDFLLTCDEETPFLLYVAFTAPHDPRTPPPQFRDRYDPRAIALPPNFLPKHPFDIGDLDVRDELLAPHPRTPEVVRQHLADYYGMIGHLDEQVGVILDTLEARGLASDTIVVYTADHGLAVGQHGLFGKTNLYDHSIKVPLVIRGAGFPAGKKISEVVTPHDVGPTLLDLAGAPNPATAEGTSLRSLLEGERIRETAFSYYKNYQRAVRDQRFKLIRYFSDPTTGQGSDYRQLFDTEADPYELNDISGDPEYAKIIAELEASMKRWQYSLKDPLLEEN